MRVGRLCLYCDKVFKSAQAAIDHMTDKSHCKIRWGTEEDIEEFEDFYDFWGDNGAGGGELEEGNEQEMQQDLSMGTMEYLPSGELQFTDPDGAVRLVGNRSFQRYYKQRYKQEDNRESIGKL